MKASVGRIVHYVSFGTPGGEYPSVCRAAVITNVREHGAVDLCVLNPEGFFFNTGVGFQPASDHVGGTWHWPEREED